MDSILVRRCSGCGRDFPATTEHFVMMKNKKSGWSGLSAECRECRNGRFRKWYGDNREYAVARSTETTRKYRATPEGQEKNRQWSREAKRRQLADPIEREKHNQRGRDWYAANPGAWKNFKHHQPHMKRMSTARRHAAELRATPPWLTVDHKRQLEMIYAIADYLTRKTGVPHDVDHYYPLRALTCCGLHVPWNMCVITATKNQSKGNRLPT